MGSSIDPLLSPFRPEFPRKTQDPDRLDAVIKHLGLQPHIEGGFFVETDRDRLHVSIPLLGSDSIESRNASTTIYYLLTPASPLGAFHRNRGRTVHTLHRGRGRYVLIHADRVASKTNPGGYGIDSGKEEDRWEGKARIETFIVGPNVEAGERLQWIVDGGKYKCSFLLPDEEGGDSSEGLLISETVVPGFEYADHDFMKAERMDALVTSEQRAEMDFMLRKT